MGSGIVGQVANAGVEVWMLDLPSDGDNVNALAEKGLEKLDNPDSPGLMDDHAKTFIRVGNIRDNFDELADCDWIAEAVVERLDIKQALYRDIDKVCRDDALITSNTSTIPISLLTEGMPQSFCERFAITHFFNPVRFMRLLELVRGEHTKNEVIDVLDIFCEEQLGKGVVRCADTPGFLGNRVGVFAIQCALHTALEMGLTPPEADAIFGRPMGIPKTGVFGLYDLIGIDLMSDVAQSLVNTLQPEDRFHRYSKPVPLMQEMIKKGQIGNKNGKGFYTEDDGQRQVIDLITGEYSPGDRLALPIAEQAERDGVAVLLDDDSQYGLYAWCVLSEALCYAASLIPEVGDDPLQIDDAVKLGFNWIHGPFELLDQIGVENFIARLEQEDRPVPQILRKANNGFYQTSAGTLQNLYNDGAYHPITRADGVLRFSELRQTLTAVNENEVASWFRFEDAAIVEWHSKANALNTDSMMILSDAIEHAETEKLRGVIVHNDAQHFSCGVNLAAIRGYFENDDYTGLDNFLNHFQQTVLSMRTANVPVIAAPVGMSIGGGFEVVLHADLVICHANSVTGLVETGVGVVPGGGGVKESLYRWHEKTGDIKKAAHKAFMNLGYAKTASSPILAKEQAMLREHDQFLMNRDRILRSALAALDNTSKAPAREPIAMAGKESFKEMKEWLADAGNKGWLMPHEITTGTEIARIVTGGDCKAGTLHSEQDLFDAERASFLTLAATSQTQARIRSMLDEGKALRN